MSKQIILYGLGGPEKAYAVLAYWIIFEKDLSADAIGGNAAKMRAYNPCIKQVFMIDNSPSLKREYEESYRLNSIESHMIFKDLLERQGWELK